MENAHGPSEKFDGKVIYVESTGKFGITGRKEVTVVVTLRYGKYV